MPTTLNTQKRANRLIGEKSPYLLQHAHNPVDWFPWGEEAFERARREDKPVFLSIGYSTCHWCHVMERESFEDVEAARALNDAFVCVKVDREERPDLDQVYMAVCMALTGAGGWPLTIMMTADKQPFFAGTYFPKSRRWGRPGLMEIVPQIKNAWMTRREEVLDSSEKIMTEVLRKRSPMTGERGPAPETLEDAARELEADFDDTNGGFGAAPKFPAPHNLSFLLRFWKKTGRKRPLAMVERTLDAMRAGGIFDQLGFGFHRYSTDPGWLVPHFEKMLYDQAMISLAFTEAFLATGRGEYKATSLGTLDYVLRDLASPGGGFYSAEDADSEGEEGRFYVWTEREIREALEEDEAALALCAFSIRPEGNFAEPGRSPDGRNVLHRAPRAPADQGARYEGRLRRIREKLFLAREKRPHPFKDTKLLADWNGMAIAALAAAGRIAEDPCYIRAAERAARFVLGKMHDPGGRLFHVYSGGLARVPAFLDDHAFMINGLIEVYESTFDPFYLREAVGLADKAFDLFINRDEGGFYFAPPDTEFGLRMRETYDGATPSGNSMMLMDLLRLARLTGRPDFDETASASAAALSGEAGAHPRAHTALLSAMDFALGPSHEIVIVGKRGDERTEALLDVIKKNFLPNVVTLFKPEGVGAEALASIAPFTRTMGTLEGRPVAYVCAKGYCLRPVEKPGDLLEILSQPGPE